MCPVARLDLSDGHRAATAGVAVARRAPDTTTAPPPGPERSTSRSIAKLATYAKLGVRASWTKNAAAWLMERLSRLKPNGRGHGDNSLQRLHELETLSLGIAGKQALWEALRAAPQSAAIAELDLDELHERARSQRERVEMERIALARVALSLSPEASQRPLDEMRATPVGR